MLLQTNRFITGPSDPAQGFIVPSQPMRSGTLKEAEEPWVEKEKAGMEKQVETKRTRR
jgi:hypothetical protein